MNSYYGPQNSYYGQPNTYDAPAPQPQYAPMPVAPQNSGSGMKMAAVCWPCWPSASAPSR